MTNALIIGSALVILYYIYIRGELLMATVEDVAARVGDVERATARAATELRDLASKIGNATDPAKLDAISAKLVSIAEGLNTVVGEVDTDNSSPA